ncbi:hypothetical protein [Enterobacter sp.]|uniref:hypothetical protein n=1 Tax=Enterobacter sp. TaxID=42895 RepID=UPI00296E3300|nr:hypothetical protein [Enterobacter sp.]
MKLIELLVQELPKRGGWPDGAEIICSHGNGHVYAYATKGRTSGRQLPIYGCSGQAVTREEYESALAAAQPQWDGEGLPPVGFNIIVTPHNNLWGFSSVDDFIGKVVAYDGDEFWFKISNGVKIASRTDKVDFLPIRSEVDKKRDAAVDELSSVIDYRNGCSSKPLAGWLYDAIAAGKIPHVHIE